MATKKHTARIHSSASPIRTYADAVKEMPSFLKLLFALSVYSIFVSLYNIGVGAPVDFSYFGTTFPRSIPFVWHAISILLNLSAIIVYLKRSYSWLIVYLNITVGILIVTAVNSTLIVNTLPQNQQLLALITTLTSFGVGIALYYYQLAQRKYFRLP